MKKARMFAKHNGHIYLLVFFYLFVCLFAWPSLHNTVHSAVKGFRNFQTKRSSVVNMSFFDLHDPERVSLSSVHKIPCMHEVGSYFKYRDELPSVRDEESDI